MENITIEIKKEEIEKIVLDPFLNDFQQAFKIASLVLEKFNNKTFNEVANHTSEEKIMDNIINRENKVTINTFEYMSLVENNERLTIISFLVRDLINNHTRLDYNGFLKPSSVELENVILKLLATYDYEERLEELRERENNND